MFLKQYGWVPLDPIRAEKSATFKRLKNIYIYLGRQRRFPLLQWGHFYGYTYPSGQGVKVTSSFREVKR